MIKIGITGQAGFIGTHLFNFFGLKRDEIIRIPFEDNYFTETQKLEDFVRQCDVVIHLAALNRHNDPQTIYNTNILLVKKLITAMENSNSRPHVLFASSTQEERDNPFSRSKRVGRELLAAWAEKNNAPFTGLVIPNVFGPFGHPYYNSVVATFCHQLTHNEQPKIEIDAQLKLIYIGELVEVVYKAISNQRSAISDQQSADSYQRPAFSDQRSASEYKVPYTAEMKVTEILEQVMRFKAEYFDKGMFPSLHSIFERDLFNTFRCYMDIGRIYPVKLKMNTDDRGTFVETIKTQLGGQVSFSTTKLGITRGNHFHTRKIERFTVIKGKACIQLRRIGSDEVLNFDLDGKEPSYVDMPIWYTHNITNIGEEDLYTIFWINELFDPKDPDTFFEPV